MSQLFSDFKRLNTIYEALHFRIEILNSHPESQETIDEAIEIIKKYKAIEYAREKANQIVKDAWKKVDKVLPKSEAKGILKDFADFMVSRKV